MPEPALTAGGRGAMAGQDNGIPAKLPDGAPSSASATLAARAGAFDSATIGTAARAAAGSDSTERAAGRRADGVLATAALAKGASGEGASAHRARAPAPAMPEPALTTGGRGAMAGQSIGMAEKLQEGAPTSARATTGARPGTKGPAALAPGSVISNRHSSLPSTLAKAGLAASGAAPVQTGLATQTVSASAIESAPQPALPPPPAGALDADNVGGLHALRSASRDGMKSALGIEAAAPMRIAGPAATAPAGDIARAAGGRDIVDQVVPALQRASGGRVELMLSPAELGRVEITLQNRDGAMSVSLSAERSETLELLRRHIDLLADDMRRLGFTDLAFSFADGSAHGSGGDGSAAGGNGTGASPASVGIDTNQPAGPAGAASAGSSATAHLDLRL
ncbi:MAG: flagellar hook-length control protein FliK [Pararhodobacter sp.]|nr:flagellar hook-length control protein FliK [Pararhodobacter sp.]